MRKRNTEQNNLNQKLYYFKNREELLSKQKEIYKYKKYLKKEDKTEEEILFIKKYEEMVLERDKNKERLTDEEKKEKNRKYQREYYKKKRNNENKITRNNIQIEYNLTKEEYTTFYSRYNYDIQRNGLIGVSFGDWLDNTQKEKEEKYKRVIDFLNKMYIKQHNFDSISIFELVFIYDDIYKIKNIEDIDLENDVKMMYSRLLKDFVEFDEYYSISLSVT